MEEAADYDGNERLSRVRWMTPEDHIRPGTKYDMLFQFRSTSHTPKMRSSTGGDVR